MTNFAKKIYKKIIIFLFLIIYGYIYFNNQKLFFKEKILLKFKKKNTITIYITLKMQEYILTVFTV